ncbi:glycosyltransferase family 4 protein [Mangrovibacillus sp. Mu-81]|uniref:glycosyltransferase family 4 protein n=1 Tax=Mangrovibacillus sp. Mu-81 TaxID=3121478 RepID=UPI002FE47906
MKIWIYNHYAVGPNSSGITRHFDLGKELVKLGHEVTIFAASFNHQKRVEEKQYSTGEQFQVQSYEGVEFVWIKTPSYHKNDHKRVLNILAYSKRVNKIALSFKEKPDVVIGSLMHPLAALSAYRLAQKTEALFYFEERDLWPQSLIDLGKVSPNNPIVKVLSKLELFLYRKADKILVLFDKAPQYVKSRGVNENKVLYLPNGVDMNRYSEKGMGKLPLDLQTKLDELAENKFIVMYTGAHSLANNLDALLNIAKQVQTNTDKIQFVLVGDGPDKQKLIKRANNENVGNIHFMDAVQKELIPDILKYADVGIISMKNAEVYKWGISLNKMYDYMAAKLPIVMLSDLKDTIISKQDIGYVSENENDIVSKLLWLYKNPEKAVQIGEKANVVVDQTHSWSTLAIKLNKELEKDQDNN